MRSLGVTVAMVSVALLASSAGDGRKHRQWRPDAVTHIRYQPYVVRGTIESARITSVPMRIGPDMFHPGGATDDYLVVTLRVEEMLKGSYRQPNIDVLFHAGAVGQVEPKPVLGSEVIVCADVKAPLWELLPGYLVISADAWLARGDGTEWKSLGTGQTFHLNDIKQIIDESSMPTVVKEADLVIEGEVVNIEVEELRPPEEHVRSGDVIGVGEVQTITMRVETVQKGPAEVGGHITFRMVRRGGYSPWWRREVPRCMEVNQHWLVALQDDPQIGYFPFAGSNGLLRIEANGEMSYEGLSRFPSKYGLSKSQVGEVIHDALQ